VTAKPDGLLPALLAVQAEAPTLPKNATNPHYKSKFCPLDTIVETIGPLLAKNGLVWTTLPGVNEARAASAHVPAPARAGGESSRGRCRCCCRSRTRRAGLGDHVRARYAICAVLNLVADDDDDGHRAATAGQKQQQDPGLASVQAKKFLRTLITQNRLDEPTMRKLFRSVEFEVPANVKVNAAIDQLSREQCSQLIDFIKEGAVPTGESDVPSDDAPAHEPTPDDQFAPAQEPLSLMQPVRLQRELAQRQTGLERAARIEDELTADLEGLRGEGGALPRRARPPHPRASPTRGWQSPRARSSRRVTSESPSCVRNATSLRG
jgi:hypothetical protein